MEKKQIEEILINNLKTFYAFFLNRGINDEDSKDLVQDLALICLSNSNKITDNKFIYAYIYGISNNLIKKYYKNRKKRNYGKLDDNIVTFDNHLIKNDRLSIELAFLKNNYRKCVTYYYYENKSISEISKILNISKEMVKYYLFKARNILKENLKMEKEFGRRSYLPDEVTFNVLYKNNTDESYENLFNRKLIGNILLACYYNPMSILEISIELGVACVYMEDEIELLLKYNLIKKIDNKYQSNIICLTSDFYENINNSFNKLFKNDIETVVNKIKNKAEELSEIYNYNLLIKNIWPLFFNTYGHLFNFSRLYDGIEGISYLTTYKSNYSFIQIIGKTPISNDYIASCLYFKFYDDITFNEINYDKLYNEIIKNKKEFLIVEKEKLINLFSDEIKSFYKLIERVNNYLKDKLLEFSPSFFKSTLINNIIEANLSLCYELICKSMVDNKMINDNRMNFESLIIYNKSTN